MAQKEKQKEELGGFTIGDIGQMMFGKPGPDNIIPEVTPEELEEKLKGEPTEEEEESGEPEKTEESEEKVEENEEKESEETDLSEVEGDISSYFMKRFADEIGFNLEEEEKFEKVGDVIDYIKTVVEENSVPDYANEETKKFDEFVKQGGDLRTFYESVYSGKINPEKIDLELEENQRVIIRENLRNAGYKEEKITSTIERYEDAGILKDQAEDALELIKEHNKEKENKLLEEQKKYSTELSKQQQKFFTDVQSGIKELKDIRGINISETDKRDLLTYIFKVDSDGVTQYQRDYAQNLTKNLIESAYFTKMGDKFLDKVKRKADNDAIIKLKQKVNDSKGKRTIGSKGQEGEKGSVSLHSLSEFFQKS
jgi:hypothetical protein